MNPTTEELRNTARAWTTGRLRRYVLVAGWLWPDDVHVAVAREELQRRPARAGLRRLLKSPRRA